MPVIGNQLSMIILQAANSQEFSHAFHIPWRIKRATAICLASTRSIEQMQGLSFGWIAELWLRNFVLIAVVAGALHWWFYSHKGQGDRLKYDPRDVKNGRMFTFGRQVWDNVFWTCR